MFSFMKYTVIMIGLLLISTGVGFFVLSTYVEQVTMKTIERSLSDIFAAPVTVKSVSISPINRSLQLRGFELANPAGYPQDVPAIRSEKIVLSFHPKTLLTDSPVVRQVVFENTDVFYRHKFGKGVNIDKLAERAEFAAAQAGPDAYPKLVIEELHCAGARVHFSTNVVPLASVGLDLVDVHMSGLQGRGNSTNNTRMVAKLFLQSVARELTMIGQTRDIEQDEVRHGIGSIADKVTSQDISILP